MSTPLATLSFSKQLGRSYLSGRCEAEPYLGGRVLLDNTTLCRLWTEEGCKGNVPAICLTRAWACDVGIVRDLAGCVDTCTMQDASDDVTVWLDILSVNQHEDTLAHSFDVHPHAFRSTVSACTAGTLVVMDRERCSPATRCWCIFEW